MSKCEHDGVPRIWRRGLWWLQVAFAKVRYVPDPEFRGTRLRQTCRGKGGREGRVREERKQTRVKERHWLAGPASHCPPFNAPLHSMASLSRLTQLPAPHPGSYPPFLRALSRCSASVVTIAALFSKFPNRFFLFSATPRRSRSSSAFPPKKHANTGPCCTPMTRNRLELDRSHRRRVSLATLALRLLPSNPHAL